MKELVRFVFAVFLLLGTLAGIAAAQKLPPIDVSGGYSYFRFDQPASGSTPYEQLHLNGWDASASVGLFHHLAAEMDLSGHQQGDCADQSGFTCKNFSYMFGPRFTIGDRTSPLTFFAHGLIGRDNATLYGFNSTAVPTNTSISAAAGAGGVYWFSKYFGVQFGPFDYIYTDHLKNQGASNQGSFRAGGGIAFRVGGNFGPPEPKAPKEESESGGHRSWTRPWHKTYPEGQPAEAPAPKPSSRKSAPPVAAPAPASTPSRGMPVRSLGVVAAPQEFDGALILSIEPGSVGEMASLHVGDLIKAVDGKVVRTPMELAVELSDKTGKVRITIERGKVTTETVLLLGAH
jgi:hypothetical protein